MEESIRPLVSEAFKNFTDRLLLFLPNMLLALVVLVAGLVISLLVGYLVRTLLAALGLDRHAERSGIIALLNKSGLKGGLSRLVASLVYWLLVMMFVIISLGTLNLPQVDRLLAEFFLYLPNVFVAAAVLFVGYVLSNFLAKSVLVAAVNAGWRKPGVLSKTVRLVVMLLAVTMSLEQLGIGRFAILIVFSIMFGGLVLTLSLAFGLGAKDLAREILEERMKEDKDEEKDEISHI